MGMFAADSDTLDAFGFAGHRAAAANGWPTRAQQVLSALGIRPSELDA